MIEIRDRDEKSFIFLELPATELIALVLEKIHVLVLNGTVVVLH